MNVEIGAEAVIFPEKEYLRGVFVAVCVSIVYFSYNFLKTCAYFFWFNTVKDSKFEKDIACSSFVNQGQGSLTLLCLFQARGRLLLTCHFPSSSTYTSTPLRTPAWLPPKTVSRPN
jgi:hypothetical protein